MSPFAIALMLLLLGLSLAVLELILPTAGVLGGLAGICMLAAILYAYIRVDLATGTAFLAMAVIVVPILIGFALQLWPKTPIGKLFILDTPESDDEETVHPSIIGKRGIAKSPLLPSGVAEFDGRNLDVVVMGTMADQGDLVEVVEVDGNRILVAVVSDNKVEDSKPVEQPIHRDVFEEDPFA